MLLHTPKGQDVTIDFQFVAPASASKDMFSKDKSKSERVSKGKGLVMSQRVYKTFEDNSIFLKTKGYFSNVHVQDSMML